MKHHTLHLIPSFRREYPKAHCTICCRNNAAPRCTLSDYA